MSDELEFVCPRCLERARISERVLLHEREIECVCGHCGELFTALNSVPDILAKHFRSLRISLRGLG